MAAGAPPEDPAALLIALAERRFGTLTHAETCLLRAAATGEQHLTLRDDEVIEDLDVPDALPERLHLRAPLLRWVLTQPGAAGERPAWRIQTGPARVRGPLDLSFARVVNPLVLSGFVFEEPIDAYHAQLRDLVLLSCRLPGLSAVFAQVDGSVTIGGDTRASGPINLGSARLRGRLMLTDVVLEPVPDDTGELPVALNCYAAQIEGAVFLQGVRLRGVASFNSARLDSVEISRSRLSSSAGRPVVLRLNDATIAHGLEINEGTVALGQIRALSARIGGDVMFDDATLVFPDPGGEGTTLGEESFYCLALDRSHLGGDLRFGGCRVAGIVHLISLEVAGTVDFEGSRFIGDVADVVPLVASPPAEGVEPPQGAEPPDFSGTPAAERTIPNGVVAENMTVGDRLRWRGVQLAPNTSLNLFHAQAAKLVDDAPSWPAVGELVLEGFRYGTIAVGPEDAASRLDWIGRQGARADRPQPYQQLARVLLEGGHEHEARLVRMAQQRRRARSPATDRWTRVGLWILDATIGYGYRPERAFAWMLAVVIVGSALFALADAQGVVVRARAAGGGPPAAAEAFVPLAYSIDSFIPVLNLGYAGQWEIGSFATPRGAWVAAYRWLHIALGWFLTTVAVLAVTGLVKKE